jgi:hypothetical protein
MCADSSCGGGVLRAQAFLQPEQLDTTETWYCGRCKEHVQADKKLDLWSLPELLVVHLKRFSYSRMCRDKLDAPVDFPLSGLDLSSFVLHAQVWGMILGCMSRTGTDAGEWPVFMRGQLPANLLFHTSQYKDPPGGDKGL